MFVLVSELAGSDVFRRLGLFHAAGVVVKGNLKELLSDSRREVGHEIRAVLQVRGR